MRYFATVIVQTRQSQQAQQALKAASRLTGSTRVKRSQQAAGCQVPSGRSPSGEGKCAGKHSTQDLHTLLKQQAPASCQSAQQLLQQQSMRQGLQQKVHKQHRKSLEQRAEAARAAADAMAASKAAGVRRATALQQQGPHKRQHELLTIWHTQTLYAAI